MKRRVMLAVLSLCCACESTSALDGGPDVDAAAHDAAARDAGGDAGRDAADIRDAPVEPRDAPPPPPDIPALGPLVVESRGGPVLERAVLVTLAWEDCPIAAEIAALGDFLPASTWIHTVGDEYGVSLVGHVHLTVPGPAPTTHIEWADLEAFVEDGIAAGRWPEHPGDAAAEPIWMFYVPSSAQPQAHAGAHFDVASPSGARVVSYVGYYVPSLDLATNALVTSHELIESLTDPYPRTAPAYFGDDAHFAAIVGVGNTELSDVCPGGVTEAGFTLARSWSNRASASGRAPCQPSAAGAWVGVQGPAGPVVASAPSAFDVPLLAVGDDPSLTMDLSVASTGLPGLEVSLDRTIAHPGDMLVLHVVTDANPSSIWYARVDATMDGLLSSTWPLHVVPR